MYTSGHPKYNFKALELVKMPVGNVWVQGYYFAPTYCAANCHCWINQVKFTYLLEGVYFY